MEDSRLLLNTGEEMGNDVLVDLNLIVSLAGPGTVKVSTISFTLKTITVVLADAGTGASIGYATAVLDSNPPNTSSPIQSPDGLASGWVTFGKILDTVQYPDFGNRLGVHEQSALLDRRCYIYTGRPMVESMRVDLQDGEVSGAPVLTLGNEISATVTEILINGVKETQVELSLVTPEEFLPDCYPKYPDPLCHCNQRPITTVNGVPRNEEDDLGIDIVFANGSGGEITNNDQEALIEVAFEAAGNTVCVEDPVVPDQYGRLGPLFRQDCPPQTAYGTPSGPSCLNPPQRPPSP